MTQLSVIGPAPHSSSVGSKCAHCFLRALARADRDLRSFSLLGRYPKAPGLRDTHELEDFHASSFDRLLNVFDTSGQLTSSKASFDLVKLRPNAALLPTPPRDMWSRPSPAALRLRHERARLALSLPGVLNATRYSKMRSARPVSGIDSRVVGIRPRLWEGDVGRLQPMLIGGAQPFRWAGFAQAARRSPRAHRMSATAIYEYVSV